MHNCTVQLPRPPVSPSSILLFFTIFTSTTHQTTLNCFGSQRNSRHSSLSLFLFLFLNRHFYCSIFATLKLLLVTWATDRPPGSFQCTHKHTYSGQHSQRISFTKVLLLFLFILLFSFWFFRLLQFGLCSLLFHAKNSRSFYLSLILTNLSCLSPPSFSPMFSVSVSVPPPNAAGAYQQIPYLQFNAVPFCSFSFDQYPFLFFLHHFLLLFPFFFHDDHKHTFSVSPPFSLSSFLFFRFPFLLFIAKHHELRHRHQPMPRFEVGHRRRWRASPRVQSPTIRSTNAVNKPSLSLSLSLHTSLSLSVHWAPRPGSPLWISFSERLIPSLSLSISLLLFFFFTYTQTHPHSHPQRHCNLRRTASFPVERISLSLSLSTTCTKPICLYLPVQIKCQQPHTHTHTHLTTPTHTDTKNTHQPNRKHF